MNKVWKLTRILFKCGLGSKGEKEGKKGSGQGVRIALFVLVGVCMLPYMGMLFLAGFGGYQMLAPAGQSGLILELACYAGALVTLLFGIPMVISVFYLSSDVEKLIPLPIKPWQIVSAKFLVVICYEYLMVLVFIGPLLLGYGIAAGSGILYWIFAVLASLFLPVLPLVYASVFAMAMMRIFRRMKNKDFLTILGTILGLVLALGISAGVNSMSGNMELSEMQSLLLEKGNSLAGMISGFFPNFRFMIHGLAESDILQMLLFLGTSALVVAAFLWIAQKIYFSGVIGMNETSGRARRLTKEESARINRRSSARKAYFKKEWRQLFRTPVYFLNCALMTFIWPVIFAVPIAFSLMGSREDLDMAGVGMEEVQMLFSGDLAQGIIMLSVFGVTAFICTCSMASSTAVSREGKSYYFMKYIPVPYEIQVRAKTDLGIVIDLLGTMPYILIAGAAGVIWLGFSPAAVALSLVICGLTVVMANYLQIMVDLTKPKLSWENEQMAVKQNMNGMLAMLLVWGVSLVLGVFAVLLYGILPLYAAAGIMCAAVLAVDILLWKLVPKYGAGKLAELEG